MDDKLTVDELCGLWKVTRQTLLKWRIEKGLPYQKIGRIVRFDRKLVEEWYINQNRGEN